MKKLLTFFALTAVAASIIHAAPLEIIVSAPPGGPTDAIARVTHVYLEEKLLRNDIIVVNKPGADGRIGGKYAADRPADGSSLIIVGTGTFVFSKVLRTKLDYDYSSFDIVAPILRTPAAVIVSPHLAKTVANLPDFISLANKTPLNCGVANATSAFVAKNLLSKMNIPSIQLVQYKGSAQLLTDMVGGHVDCAIDVVASYKAQHDAGKIKIIATAGNTAESDLPNATVLNTVYPNFVFYNWFGLGILKDTPEHVKRPIINALSVMYADSMFATATSSLSFELVAPPSNPNLYIDSEYRRFENIRQAIGIEKE